MVAYGYKMKNVKNIFPHSHPIVYITKLYTNKNVSKKRKNVIIKNVITNKLINGNSFSVF